MPQLNLDEIKRHIPQREPFLFLEQVEDYEPNRHLSATRLIRATEPGLEGHFPGQPIFPGVLTLEAMVQAALLLLKLGAEPGDPQHIFGGAQRLRLSRVVTPGDTLELRAEVTRIVTGMALVRAQALVSGEEVAAAELSFGSAPKSLL